MLLNAFHWTLCVVHLFLFSPNVTVTAGLWRGMTVFSPLYQPALKCMPSHRVLMRLAVPLVSDREGESGEKEGAGLQTPTWIWKAPKGCHKCSSSPEGRSSIRTVSAAIRQPVSPQPWLTCCRLISETYPACESAQPQGLHHRADTVRSLLSLDVSLGLTQWRQDLKDSSLHNGRSFNINIQDLLGWQLK